MLYTLIVLALIALLVGNVAAFAPKRWRRPASGVTAVVLLGACSLTLRGLILNPLSLVFAWLAVTSLLVVIHPRARRTHLIASLCGVFGVSVVYAGVAYIAVGRWYNAIRAEVPFESLEERLPKRPGQGVPVEVPPTTGSRVYAKDADWRASNLRDLHEDAVALFARTPGFGFERMPHPSLVTWTFVGDVAQPVPPDSAAREVDERALVGRAADEGLSEVHLLARQSFLKSWNFGYVRDRRNVSGFAPHSFGGVPQAGGWRADSVELVSILTHIQPVAYVSAKLPRMDQLREAPTRPLTAFESQALAGLYKGEHLVAAEAGERVRMLGAIRMSAACAKCHDGAVGSLLGAFSYTLKKAP